MRYRIFKERRLLRPYKIQIWAQDGWVDCVDIVRVDRDAMVKVRYFWTKWGAEHVIRKDCTAESIYDVS